MSFCCSACGHRQDVDAACGRCGADSLLDLRRRRHRELLEEIDSRLSDRRNDRIRMIGVVAGIATIVAAGILIPGYWTARAKLFALPLLADQVIYMIVIAFGIITVLERTFNRKRSPFLDGLPPAERD